MTSETTLLRYLEEAIRLERNVAAFYRQACAVFPEDRDFWWALSIEEENHAALLRAYKDGHLPKDLFPDDALAPELSRLRASNEMIEGKIKSLAAGDVPSRRDMFEFALKIEEAAGEHHYQKAVEIRDASRPLRLFQTLNQDDKDHADRIRNRMAELPD